MGAQLTSGIWQAPPDQFEMPVGMPRPLYDGKPVPFTARVDMQVSEEGVFTPYPDFADVNWDRMNQCFLELRCLVCGDEIPDQAALIVASLDGKPIDWTGYEPGDDLDVEVREGGAFCLRCAKLAMAHCPQLRNSASSTVMIGPKRDLVVDEQLEKILNCPLSFRPLERRTSHGARDPVPSLT